MRTTINLDDQLLQAAKNRAMEGEESLSRVMEAALQNFLFTYRKNKDPGEPVRGANLFGSGPPQQPIRLLTVSGSGVKPGVDLDNGRLLSDIMDEMP